MEWTILRVSKWCPIRTTLGSFALSAFDLANPAGTVVPALVLLHGDARDGILLRISSACLTSEVFGDLSCDCGPQLGAALRHFVANGSGLLLYAPFDEGRGVGLVNKLNSMVLMQTRGLSSRAAFQALGLPPDARDFGYVPAILQHLGLSAIRILGRNPEKRAAIEASGILVQDELPSFDEAPSIG